MKNNESTDTTNRLGTATVEPKTPAVAGLMGQWTVVYTAGTHGIDDGGTIKLGHRFASDWEHPQFDRPADSGYTTVTTSGDARLKVRYDRKAHDRPWQACIVVDVYDGTLAPGDTVTFVLGDRTEGSPGMRAQTFQEAAHEFCVFVDPTNACLARSIAVYPTVRVVPGEINELICLLPTQCKVGEPVAICVRGQDKWGNPLAAPAGLKLDWVGQAPAEIREGRLTISTAGSGQVQASAGGFTCRSNPISALAAEVPLKRYWGDLHAQTNSTVGTGTEEEYFRFARDVARLDFTSHQGNDFQVTDEDWTRLNDVIRTFHSDGRFVVFPGYEWSGNTYAGGDRNVFYLEEGLPILRSSHWQVPEVPEDALSPAHPADQLFAKLRRAVGLDKCVLGCHVGGRYADIPKYFDDELGPLVEVVSCWGVFEWLLWDALDNGHVVGVMANSDGHKGRPGAEGPGAGQFGIANGLTCVLAASLTRRDVFDALRNRRCYATTGPRIDLDFQIAGRPMGSVITSASRPGGKALEARATVRGCGPIESLTLYRGKEEFLRVRPAAFDSAKDSPRIRVSWKGSRLRGRQRRVKWDGAIRLERATIRAAKTFQFDSALDGITERSDHHVSFRSQTTGDTDGIDLVLDSPRRGTILLDSPVGRCEVDLATLEVAAPRIFDMGGVDMQVCIQRYPEAIPYGPLELSCELPSQTGSDPSGANVVAPLRSASHGTRHGRTPWFVKAVQEDGHQAWSSPIYVA